MGNTCLGVFKGLTLGGIGIWMLVDTILLYVNYVQLRDHIDTFGIHCTWEDDTIETAKTLGIIGFVLLGVQTCCSICNRILQQTVKQDEDESSASFSSE